DALAGADQVHQRRRRSHPRREGEPVLGALERGEAELERLARRVGGARVVVALVLANRLLDVGGGLVDRDDHRAGGRIRLLPLVDGARLEVHSPAILGERPEAPSATGVALGAGEGLAGEADGSDGAAAAQQLLELARLGGLREQEALAEAAAQ